MQQHTEEYYKATIDSLLLELRVVRTLLNTASKDPEKALDAREFLDVLDNMALKREQDAGFESMLQEIDAAADDAARAQILEDNK